MHCLSQISQDYDAHVLASEKTALAEMWRAAPGLVPKPLVDGTFTDPSVGVRFYIYQDYGDFQPLQMFMVPTIKFWDLMATIYSVTRSKEKHFGLNHSPDLPQPVPQQESSWESFYKSSLINAIDVCQRRLGDGNRLHGHDKPTVELEKAARLLSELRHVALNSSIYKDLLRPLDDDPAFRPSLVHGNLRNDTILSIIPPEFGTETSEEQYLIINPASFLGPPECTLLPI